MDLLGRALVAVVFGVKGLEDDHGRVGVRHVLDVLGDEPHAVPDHEDARRHRRGPAHIDQDAVAAREQRLHRDPVHLDHPQVVRLGPELVADDRIGEHPRLPDLLEIIVPGPRARRRPGLDFRHDAVAFRRGVGTGGRRRLPSCFEPHAPVVPQLIGAAAQVLGQDLAVVLGEDARRAPVDELVQVRFIAPEHKRGRPQVRAVLSQQPKHFRTTVSHGKESSKFNWDCTICRRCQSMTSESIVREQRKNGPRWREFTGTIQRDLDPSTPDMLDFIHPA